MAANQRSCLGCGCGVSLIGIFFIGYLGSQFRNHTSSDTEHGPQSSGAATESTKSPSKEVPYTVVDEWPIPNGGYGRVVLIDPTYRNEAELKRLGSVLQRDTRDDRNAFVFVFDDARAASLRKNVLSDSASDDELEYYHSHFIGTYFRNANTGHHELTILIDGKTKKIPQ